MKTCIKQFEDCYAVVSDDYSLPEEERNIYTVDEGIKLGLFFDILEIAQHVFHTDRFLS